jgi:hypothetical protein
VINGLTLHGNWTTYASPASQAVFFNGPQTITAGTGTGTFHFLIQPQFAGPAGGFQALKGGPVIFDSSLTIHAGTGSGGGLVGNIINNANIVADANTALRLQGLFAGLVPANDGPFDNRANITMASGTQLGSLVLADNFINEGVIVARLATIAASGRNANVPIMKNLGTIDISDRSELVIGGGGPLKTADLGNLVVSNKSTVTLAGFTLDNTNATLTIGGGSTWNNGALLDGGTIQVTSPAKFNLLGGTLKDLTLNGNVTNQGGGALAGDITLNGTLAAGDLRFDDPTNSNLPVRIHSGTIDVQDTVLNAFQSTITDTGRESSIIFDAGVTLLGRLHPRVSITKPIENHGTIVADRYSPFQTGDVFEFPVGPITNTGILSAVSGSTLLIANLAAPNTGLVTASAGGSVQFTGAFAQAAAGTTHVDVAGTAADKFGLVTIAGAATLAGTLDVKFASGYTPNAGDTYKILTFGSHTGSFATLNVTGLASGLTVSPQYNDSDLTLVVGTTAGLMANFAAEGEANSLPTRAPAIRIAPEQLFPHSSTRRPLSVSTSSTYSIDPVKKLPLAGNLKSSNGVAQDSLSEFQSSTKLGNSKDNSAAIDEVFANIDHELLLTTKI